ncbi:hypothetical protein GH714_014940 [Hevea brasiliensis]|uniref:Protein kinase domain-containing protein n=1 Tax=Hevea brasiliensis TaxID=3981 RepID=A0A6A6M0M5_HEVBR|nr:hypothetical protein GH714_014940 [Hevea brasiliensis]
MSFLIAPSKESPRASLGQFFGRLNHTSNVISSNHIVAIKLDTFQDQEFNDINDNHASIDINSLVSVKLASADMASTLAYLHEESEIVTSHRDIKASNVLLDGELNGKFGDFGLAKCSKHAHDAHIVGTLDYNASELAKSGKATTGTDVYAFGVFCLEVACR